MVGWRVGWRLDWIASALRGENPTVLARLGSGFAVIGDNQFLRGYCLLLSDDPTADRPADLPRARRLAFLADLDLVGQAVHSVCSREVPGFRRVNCSVLGNLDTYLHGLVHARYDWEPADLVTGPVARYPTVVRTAEATALGSQHDKVRAELTAELCRL